MASGILSTSHSFNPKFIEILSYYDIEIGSTEPKWGLGNKNFSYYACSGFPDQINLYRFQRLGKGGLYKGATILDLTDATRTLYMPYKFDLQILWQIPDYVEDNFEESIKNLVSKYTCQHDHLSILWSGGVDSSAMLAGFIKYGDKSKFSIGYTEVSISEYPLFFNFLEKNGFDLVSLDDRNISDLPGMIVHGVGGGPICDQAPSYSARSLFDKPWHAALDKDEWGDCYYELYEFSEQYLKHYGKENPTVADLCTFGNLSTKVNNGYMQLHYDVNLRKNRMLCFYDDYLMKQWNYHHCEKYLIDSHLPNKYKLHAKKVVYDLLKDQEYVDTKTKGFSQDLWKKKCNIVVAGEYVNHNYFFIDSSEERITADSKDEFFEKYGDRFNHYFNKPL